MTERYEITVAGHVGTALLAALRAERLDADRVGDRTVVLLSTGDLAGTLRHLRSRGIAVLDVRLRRPG